jgi:hypothetical protein
MQSKSEDAPASTLSQPGRLVANDFYQPTRRMFWILVLSSDAVLVAVGYIIGTRPGLLIVLPFTVFLALVIGIFCMEVYPAIDLLPHHVGSDSSGLILVRRYLFKDRYQRVRWEDIAAVHSTKESTSDHTERYVVSFRDPKHSGASYTFVVSEGAVGQIKKNAPSATLAL